MCIWGRGGAEATGRQLCVCSDTLTYSLEMRSLTGSEFTDWARHMHTRAHTKITDRVFHMLT